MTAVRFTLADLEAAHASWRCSCGPAALAAICGLTLDAVRPHFPGFKGWTNPVMMRQALERTGRRFHFELSERPLWPRYGLALIAFEGPWTEPNPTRERWLKIERAKRSHWVGVSRLQLMSGGEDPDAVCVWDCNAMDIGRGWSPIAWWSSQVAPRLTADIKRATGGWHITHAIEVAR